MKNINRIQLLGNIGKEPELRKTNGETSVVSFPMATSESFKNKAGEWQEQTEWHNIVAWRELADSIEKNCNKGDTILVEGKVKTRSWDSKEGEKRYITEVVIDNFILIKKKAV